MGTQQSGALDLLIADLGKDGEILKIAREAAQQILESDPALDKPEHHVVRQQVDSLKRTVVNWSRIS